MIRRLICRNERKLAKEEAETYLRLRLEGLLKTMTSGNIGLATQTLRDWLTRIR